MAKLRLIISTTLLVLAIIFVLQNTEVVNINFLFWRFSLSRVLLIFILLILGMMIGWLLHSQVNNRSRKGDK